VGVAQDGLRRRAEGVAADDEQVGMKAALSRPAAAVAPAAACVCAGTLDSEAIRAAWASASAAWSRNPEARVTLRSSRRVLGAASAAAWRTASRPCRVPSTPQTIEAGQAVAADPGEAAGERASSVMAPPASPRARAMSSGSGHRTRRETTDRVRRG
jgi:hypothetical protein